jgi:hypothetical protein
VPLNEDVAAKATEKWLKSPQAKLREQKFKRCCGPLYDIVVKRLVAGHSMRMLKFAYAVQQARVQRLIEFEEKAGLTMPTGYKDVELLTDIGDAVRRLEIGEPAKSEPCLTQSVARSPAQTHTKLGTRCEAPNRRLHWL